jgi:hypothetical protein
MKIRHLDSTALALDGRSAHLVPAIGKILLNGVLMDVRDGCAIWSGQTLAISRGAA